MLSGSKFSLQNTLNKFFKRLGKVFEVPTDAAYCQAKKKVRAEVFVHLSQVICDDFYRLYEADGGVYRWRGHRLLGADGTYLQLPDTDSLREAFSVFSNQHASGETVQALGLVLHDLLNDLAVAAAIGSGNQAEKSLLFSESIESHLQAGDVLVLDRLSCDYSILARLAKAGIDYVVRCSESGTFKLIEEFWQSPDSERVGRLKCSHKASTRAVVKAEGLAEELEVRLLKFELENGDREVLLTSLSDREKYPAEEFYQVYGWRWRDETFYDRLKNIFELERFSGQTAESVRQDYYGVIFLANLESVLSREAENELQAEAAERGTETTPQVNHAVSYVALVGEVGELLADREKSVDEILKELKHLFRQNPTRIRPNRRYSREKQSHSRKLRYHRFTKRVIA